MYITMREYSEKELIVKKHGWLLNLAKDYNSQLDRKQPRKTDPYHAMFYSNSKLKVATTPLHKT